MLLSLIQALRRKISWPGHVGGCRKGSLKFLSCCAPQGAHNLGVLLKKWTQSSILVLGSETACLYYRWKFGCDCDSVLWLVVLWQRNHDSQLPLTQQGHTSQGWALTMVLICPSRPHRLLRDEDYPFHKQNCEKSWNYWCASFLLLFCRYQSRQQQLMITSLISLSMPHACQLLSKCYGLHCSIYELPLSLDWWCDRKHPCQIEVQKNHTFRIRKGSVSVRITDLSIPVILL